MYRKQRNVTLTEQQLSFVLESLGKKTIGQMAKEINVGYGKIYKNLRVMGKIIPEGEKEICFEKDGYFDVDKFGKLYNF